VMLNRSILDRPVQQTSWTGAEGRAVRREDAQEEFRVHSVSGLRVGLLCCGEIFSPVVKKVLSNLAPTVVINMAHRPMEGNEGTYFPQIPRRFSLDFPGPPRSVVVDHPHAQ
jgi:hypothetical protein